MLNCYKQLVFAREPRVEIGHACAKDFVFYYTHFLIFLRLDGDFFNVLTSRLSFEQESLCCFVVLRYLEVLECFCCCKSYSTDSIFGKVCGQILGKYWKIFEPAELYFFELA